MGCFVLFGTELRFREYAEAPRRIAFALQTSLTSRSSPLIRPRSGVVRRSRGPTSRSSCRTHCRRVSPVQPILAATDSIAFPRRLVLGSALGNHADRSLPYLGRVRRLPLDCSILSRVGASEIPRGGSPPLNRLRSPRHLRRSWGPTNTHPCPSLEELVSRQGGSQELTP